ncbi:MAG: hypothetical protein H7Y27_12065, partial [Gemmatimonadaceae bacterium]|nr:hypothetical protein [Chitinophagaceae bacterium]
MKSLQQLLCLFVTLSLCTTSFSQQIDTSYNRQIKEFTTDKRFLPASVLNLIDDP